MCGACLSDRVDITKDISRTGELFLCKSCGQYASSIITTSQGSPKFAPVALESPELLSICLKSINGLSRGKQRNSLTNIKVLDAKFIWTEPHSRRVKVEVEIEKEVEEFNHILLRQAFKVEFIVQTKMCSECQKETTDRVWNTTVQLRQHVSHKKTLLNLESRLGKDHPEVLTSVLNIVTKKDGLDFYFRSKSAGSKFIEKVSAMTPVVSKKETKSLVSTDVKNNIHYNKYMMYLEVSPVCRYDCVLLSKALRNSLFNGGCCLTLCDQVTKSIRLVDPSTGKTAFLPAISPSSAYSIVFVAKELTEFTVLDVIPADDARRYTQQTGKSGSGTLEVASQDVICEVQVARTEDFGVNDNQYMAISHLGANLSPGDAVFGYSFSSRNFSDEMQSITKGWELPDVVLVKKK